MKSIEESSEIEVPVTVAYNRWTQVEEFPRFMEGVEKVEQLDDRRLHWVAEEFIESSGSEMGAWRGDVDRPGAQR